MTASKSKIQGLVETISHHNSESGWTVIKLRNDSDNRLITLTGHFSSVSEGEYIEAQGSWFEHKFHGLQFKASETRLSRPQTVEAILKYLSSGMIKGIGKVIAKRIVSHFGARTFQILDHSSERLIEVPGIGGKKAHEIIAIWNKNRSYRETEAFLSGHDLSPRMITKILKRYGLEAKNKLTKNPYRLASEISGVGFITADQIAQKLGIPSDAPERIEAAIVFSIQAAQDQGHCYLTSSQLIKKLSQLLKIEEKTIEDSLDKAITKLNEDGFIISEDANPNEQIHYLFSTRIEEEELAKRLSDFLSSRLDADIERIKNWLKIYSERARIDLSEQQKRAVIESASNKLFILTGGPGVGKTTTANTIIRLLQAMNLSVSLSAPTGRAAQRLTEMTGQSAKTVHRLLEWNPAENGFLRDEDNPLDADVILVDEASMLDLNLSYHLIKACPERGRIILIGDVDQLPSVGCGNVLRDLIESNLITYTKLDQIFRQSKKSDIVKIAHEINQGKSPSFDSNTTSDCCFIEADSIEDIRQSILDLVCRELPEKHHFDPIKDIQILSPMNRGELGSEALNEVLQDKLNPANKQLKADKANNRNIRPGDKVIQIANNYDLNVFNGDIGVVIHTNFDGGKTLVEFSERKITYSKEQLSELRLAYAITIHKSQGSEFPVVLIPMSLGHYIMLQRNLVYTALTRAKKLAIFVGSKQALDQAVSIQKSLSRQTKLIDRLHKYSKD